MLLYKTIFHAPPTPVFRDGRAQLKKKLYRDIHHQHANGLKLKNQTRMKTKNHAFNESFFYILLTKTKTAYPNKS